MEEDWITADELRAALDAGGPPISVHQIERWRREGLLPRPRQIGRGRGGGSHTIVTPASVAQAREIAHLYGVREKRDWVGWQLWLRGYAVAEHFWREPLEGAVNSFELVRKVAKAFARKMERQGPAISATALRNSQSSAHFAGLAKLPSDMAETVIGYGFEIASGTFSGLTLDSEGNANSRDLGSVIEAIGASPAKRHEINGNGIDFAGQLEPALIDIAKAISRVAERPEIAEPPLEARREFLLGMEIGSNLNQLFKPTFGRNALGLGIFRRIAANPAISIQAAMLVVWAEYRESSKAKLPFAEIEAMHLAVKQLTAKTSD